MIQTQATYSDRLHQQLTRRVRRTMILIVTLGASFVIVSLIVMNLNNLRDERERATTFVASEVTQQLDIAAADVFRIGNSVVMRDYARRLSLPTGSFSDPAVDEAIASELTNLIASGNGLYESARIITVDGRVRAAAVLTETGIEISTTTGNFDHFDDPVIADVLADTTGTTVYYSEDANGEVLHVFLPVIDSATQTPELIIEVEVSVPVLIDELAVVSSSTLLTEPGRRVMVVSDQGDLLLDTQPIGNPGILDIVVDRGDGNPFDVQEFNNNLEAITMITIAPYMPEVGNERDIFAWQVVVVDEIVTALPRLWLVIAATILPAMMVAIFVTRFVSGLMRKTIEPYGTVQSMTAYLDNGVEGEFNTLPVGVVPGNRPRPAPPGTAPPVSSGETGNDVEAIIGAIGRASARLYDLTAQLDRQVERHNRDLEIASRIGRETAVMQDIDALLDRAIDLICDELGVYHAQVFLVDDVRRYAVLVASQGKAGEILLEQGHKIELGSRTVIGTVTGQGQAVIVNDTQRDQQPHAFNAVLADTRAEMGLPLIIQDTVIGALDVQSREPDTFREDDLPVYRLLADQLAIAIHNARLAGESRQYIEQIDQLNRSRVRQAWERYDDGSARAYRYNLLNVAPLDVDDYQPGDGTIDLPITIGGETIGTLSASPGVDSTLTAGEQAVLRAVAERVALALEQARLFQETQATLSETELLYQLSTQLNEAETLTDVLETVVGTVMDDAVAGHIWIFDEYEFDGDEWLAMVAAYSQDDLSFDTQRLHAPDHPLLRDLTQQRIVLVNDLMLDARMDDELGKLLTTGNARSVAIMSLYARGSRLGLVIVTFPEARTFSESDGRIYRSVVDQAGVAIDNRLLTEQTERALQQQEMLYASSRIINSAQSHKELIHAVVSTSSDPRRNFQLALLEGELGRDGWPTMARIVARSRGVTVEETDLLQPIYVSPDSPMRLREPEVIIDETPNLQNVPRAVKMMREQGHRFQVTFPLFSANMPIALLTITAPETSELSMEDSEIYRALTGQMSIQLENRRLLQRTERALDETRRLYIASRAIIDAQETRGVYFAVTEHLATPLLRQAMDGQEQMIKIVLLLTRPQPTWNAPFLEVVHAWTNSEGGVGHLSSGRRLVIREMPVNQLILEHNNSLHFSDLSERGVSKDEQTVRDLLRQNDAASAVVAPVQARQRWFGVLISQSDHPQAFTEQYLRFMDGIADQLALAIENRMLFDEAQIEAERAQSEARRALALAEAAQLANRVGLEFDESFSEAFARIAEAAGYDRWLLLFNDERTNRLDVMVSNIEVLDAGKDSLTLDDEQPAVTAFRSGRTLLVNDPLSYPAYSALSEVEQQKIAHAYGKSVAVPIRSGERSFGALVVGRSLGSDDLDEADEQLVETLATQVAVALENRRLFRAVQDEQRILQSILSTLPAGVVVFDPDTLRPTIVNDSARDYLPHAALSSNAAFSAENYHLYRTGTDLLYPENEVPVAMVARTGRLSVKDDVVMHYGEFEVDLQVSAAPIVNANGDISAIVATFTDVTTLRTMENTLQETLRETLAISDAQRQLAEAVEMNTLVDGLQFQLALVMQPTELFVIVRDDDSGQLSIERSMRAEDVNVEALRVLLNPMNTQYIRDVTTANVPAATLSILQDLDIVSLMSAPIRSRQSQAVYGWMVVCSDTPMGFSAEQERVFHQLSEIASTEMENRRLIEATQAALRETDVLYRATTGISRARDLDDLVDVLEQSLQTMNADAYGVFLLESALDRRDLLMSDDKTLALMPAMLSRHDLDEQGVFIDDLVNLVMPDALERDLMAAVADIAAIAIVPVRVDDELSGRLVVAYRQPQRFQDSTRRYLRALVDSVSVVLDNVLLVEEIQSTLEETTMLYQASRNLSDAVDTKDILDIIVEFVIPGWVDQVFIALLNNQPWDSPLATLTVTNAWTPDGEHPLLGFKLTADDFPMWNQISTPALLAIDNTQEAPYLDPVEREGFAAFGANSAVLIPLRVPKRVIGVVWISSAQTHRYNDRENRVYQSVGEQASLTMENAYLLGQTERRAAQLQASAEIGAKAGALLELDKLLPDVVKSIRDSFGYDHAQVFLMDERNEYAELVASTGEVGQQLLARKHKLRRGSRSVIGQVTETGRPTIAADTMDAGVIHRPNPLLSATRAELALPLLIKGRVIGAMDVQSNTPNAFTRDDVVALTTLANQIAITIDNANLFQDAQQQADRMSFLFDITTLASFAPTVTDAMQTIADRLLENQNALVVVTYLKQDYIDADEETVEVLSAATFSGLDQPLAEIERARLDDESNLLGWVAAQKQPYIIETITDEPTYLPVSAAAQSAVIAPLVVGAELLGAIVMEADHPNAYDYEEIQLLLTLTGSVSAVIQSAQLIEQLQQATEELRELDRVKSDFLANMSHELRTPLNSIIGFSRVMLKGIDGPLTEMQEQDLTTIFKSGQHLLLLINDILDQAKIAAGKMDLKFDFFEIAPLIDAVKSIGIGLLKDKPISLRVDMSANMPKVYGDEFRTRQVLLNILSNATKFTNDGVITIRAYTILQPGTGIPFVRVEVEDTGIGIAQKDIPLLFEAFRQVDSSLTRTQGGTGLGLPIAKSLIEMQGGEMAVESELNIGSTFSITIPTEPVMPEPEEPEDESDSSEPDETPVNRPRETRVVARQTLEAKLINTKRQVLLIEDNPDMVDQYRRMLQREGFEVLAASIPLEAEAMASGLHPTLILMDVNFASGQGWDILQRLKDRDDTFDIPIIVVTLSDESERAFQLGAHSFIVRPYNPDDIVDAALAAETESNRERILIIDDTESDVRLLMQLLDEHGKYRVFTANNGREGIALVARRRPDLVILDLRMPDMDGFAVLKELRSNPETSAIPVIVVTGDAGLSEDEQQQLENVRVLAKTDISQAEYDEFIARVQRHLNGDEG